MEGRLIGINTAILSQSGDSAGIGFAVPINQIRRVLPELIATGKVLRPAVGWVLLDTPRGVMVRRVLAESPAEAAGLRPIERAVQSGVFRGFIRDYERADVIVRANGRDIRSREDLDEVVSQLAPQQALSLVVRGSAGRDAPRELVVKPVLR